jgi:hypothetical protein
MANPKLYYFPLAGRGELCKLIAAAGDLQLDVAAPDGIDKACYGSAGGVPLLEHGSLKMAQSLAIEAYLSEIAPKFKDLTPQQRATDTMYAAAKEDILQGILKVVFDPSPDKDKTAITTTFDKFVGVWEQLVPADGFVNKMPYPTCADLAVLFVFCAEVPTGMGLKLLGSSYDLGKFPKCKALAERTKAAPGVKEYLASDKCTMTAALPG